MSLKEYSIWTAEALDGGLVTRSPAHQLTDKQSPDAQNFDPTFVGGVKKRKGYVKFTSAAKVSPTGTFVSGLFGATLANGTSYILAAEGTALHNITAGTWPAAITGTTITVDTRVRMFMYNDLFIICNQGGGPFKWTGTGAAAALGGTPPASARGGGVHRSRVYLYTNTSVITASKLNDPETWDTTDVSSDGAYTVTVNDDDGFAINGFVSGGDFAVLSKLSPDTAGEEGALYGIYGSTRYDLTVKRIASVGALSQEAMIAFDNMVFVATHRGIYGINGRNFARIDDPIWPDYDAIPSKGTIALGRYLQTLRVSYPATGTQNNREFVLDVERGVWDRNTGKTIRIYANHPDGRLLSGTSGTSILVWEEENGTNDDAAAINFYWETPDIDFGDRESRKRLEAWFVHAKNTGSYNLTMEHYLDGSALTLSPNTMNVSTEKPIKRLEGKPKEGYFHRLRMTNNTADQDITIYGVKAFGELLQPSG